MVTTVTALPRPLDAVRVTPSVGALPLVRVAAAVPRREVGSREEDAGLDRATPILPDRADDGGVAGALLWPTRGVASVVGDPAVPPRLAVGAGSLIPRGEEVAEPATPGVATLPGLGRGTTRV